jgi:hypothetical protein
MIAPLLLYELTDLLWTSEQISEASCRYLSRCTEAAMLTLVHRLNVQHAPPRCTPEGPQTRYSD